MAYFYTGCKRFNFCHKCRYLKYNVPKNGTRDKNEFFQTLNFDGGFDAEGQWMGQNPHEIEIFILVTCYELGMYPLN